MDSATACAIDVALEATSSATFAIVESSIVFIAVVVFISVDVLSVLTICEQSAHHLHHLLDRILPLSFHRQPLYL